MLRSSSLFSVLFLFLLPSASQCLSSTALADHSAAAAGLFNNMRTPAALIGGALVPIGILSAPTIQREDGKGMRLLKKANILLGVLSLISEFLAVMYSSIAINKIAEVAQPKTFGVAQLIAEKHELAWLGTNIHFLLGTMGFALIIGSKSFFSVGAKLGKVTSAWSFAALFQALAIVNQGIAMGSTNATDEMSSNTLATNFGMLILKYIRGVVHSSKGGVCGIFAIGISIYAAYETVKTMIVEFDDKERAP
jgi:hypothetical protein